MPSAAPPDQGQTSTGLYSSGLPSGRSGTPGSGVPTQLPHLLSRWATQPQCRRQSFQHQVPPSPAALVGVLAQSRCPGSAAACPGPIPGSRNAGPGVNCNCRQNHCYSFAPGDLTSLEQCTSQKIRYHSSPVLVLLVKPRLLRCLIKHVVSESVAADDCNRLLPAGEVLKCRRGKHENCQILPSVFASFISPGLIFLLLLTLVLKPKSDEKDPRLPPITIMTFQMIMKSFYYKSNTEKEKVSQKRK